MYRKKYLIDYEQTGGALGHLTIITSEGKQISGPFEETFLRQLKSISGLYNQINFNLEGKTYKITKINDYYQIRSDDDTTLKPANYIYTLNEYKFLSIKHNSEFYKQMKINKKDYDMLCKASDVGTQYILDTIIILDSTFNYIEPIKIRVIFNSKNVYNNNIFEISLDDNNTSFEYENQYFKLFPSNGSNYEFQTYN